MASPPRRPPVASTQAKSHAQAEATVDLLHILVVQRALTGEQADKVRRAMKIANTSAEHTVLQLGILNEVQVAQAVAAHAGLRYVKINPLDLDLEVVTKALSGPFARRHGMVAIAKTDKTLTVAVHDPFRPFPDEDVKRVTGLEVERVVATKSDVETVNRGFYDLKTSLQTAERQLTASRLSTVDLANQEFLSAEATELDPAAAPVVRALDHILNYAFEQRASDIHFEPKREFTLVRLRIDGMLHDVHVIPRIVYQAVVSRIKLLSGCNLAEKRRPQDGRIKREQGGREIELRVSTMPTVFGEKAVLRIFDPEILMKGIDELGFTPQELPLFYEFIKRPTGVILVTGPTGSGKTTTLYSVLKYLSKPEVNIVTIEDPIEMVFEDFNQVAVKPQIDITFGSTLRTVLRQDPDIIMVGEIRDTETAEHAVQAALTGHLVLSTLHTNDAPSSITRLLDLGIPHFLITSVLIGILAQRLVRENCTHCLEEYPPTAEEAAALRMDFEKLKAYRFTRGRGCLHCRETGYVGRTGIYEILPMSERIRKLVTAGAGSPELFKVAREEGMRTLHESAVEKVFRGVTTVTEVVRVTGT
ncbi:MAG TPA: GspE/PulE family protein [Vicinamibacteria bacterium]|nr:GspE/PulE family protein [Vicinamibacteria bacterium]